MIANNYPTLDHMTLHDEDSATLRTKLFCGEYEPTKVIELLFIRLEAAEAMARTSLNYRLTREDKRSDWKEHLERFDACTERWKKIRADWK